MKSYGTLAVSFLAATASATADGVIHRYLGDEELSFSCALGSVGCFNDGDNNFQLTEVFENNTRSAIWASEPMDLTQSFVMEAQLMTDAEGGYGREGIAFVMHPNGREALGSDGNGKGYSGITPCIAVEIDTNPDHGPDSTIKLTKTTSDDVLIEGEGLGAWQDLVIRTLVVRYNADAKRILVKLDDKVVLEGDIDLQEELMYPSVTWGFTAANGDDYSADQWVYFQSLENGPEEPDVPPTEPGMPSPGQLPQGDGLNPNAPEVVFYEDFDGPTDFGFVANLFDESADTSYILGEISSTHYGKWYHDQSTGGLRLTLTGPYYAETLSGGFGVEIVLEEDIQAATLDFKYVADFQEGFGSLDEGQVFALVDETKYVIDQFIGEYPSQPLWGRCTVDLGDLSAGTHTLYIGALLATQDGTGNGKQFQVRYDNLALSGYSSLE